VPSAFFLMPCNAAATSACARRHQLSPPAMLRPSPANGATTNVILASLRVERA
jgi:hypothetical protein